MIQNDISPSSVRLANGAVVKREVVVTFVYTDELLGEDFEHEEGDEQTETLRTRAEALAFQSGLEWGDEPKYTVTGIVDQEGVVFPEMHLPVELIGGNIPAHVPGAYPRLSCCGGPKQLVPATEPDDEEYEDADEPDEEHPVDLNVEGDPTRNGAFG